MFHRLLVANRGEVAVRIAKACHKLGVTPVGIYSEADRGAHWLEEMGHTVCVGPAPSADSYLRSDRILQAAVQTRCSALHPGWGFLAEDPRSAALCRQHGITFVGPSPQVISRMGLKSPAKEAMRAAGLPVIPGSIGLVADVESAVACAAEVGYPVIIKADSGGGGRGMRRCDDEASLRQAFPEASAEARSAFGSGLLYLERFLRGGRHVEVQILADSYGHAIHLGERDCSVQRNHQKLIEEGPCPILSAERRAEIGRSAAQAAAAIGYVGAGTIEFLLSEEGELFFMEMNTRLQVEHPVTELITGVDIVCEQINIAAGRRLELRQEDVSFEGHAIECRINAEDALDNFRPTPGLLSTFEIARGEGPGTMRVDTHMAEGESVSPYYDSLVAKLIAVGQDREMAIQTMLNALQNSRIEGISTTIPMHLAVLQSAEFCAGNYDTTTLPGWPPAQARGTAS